MRTSTILFLASLALLGFVLFTEWPLDGVPLLFLCLSGPLLCDLSQHFLDGLAWYVLAALVTSLLCGLASFHLRKR